MLVEMRAKKKSSVMLRSCAHKVAAAGGVVTGLRPWRSKAKRSRFTFFRLGGDSPG